MNHMCFLIIFKFFSKLVKFNRVYFFNEKGKIYSLRKMWEEYKCGSMMYNFLVRFIDYSSGDLNTNLPHFYKS